MNGEWPYLVLLSLFDQLDYIDVVISGESNRDCGTKTRAYLPEASLINADMQFLCRAGIK
jgi:hypothetical protein